MNFPKVSKSCLVTRTFLTLTVPGESSVFAFAVVIVIAAAFVAAAFVAAAAAVVVTVIVAAVDSFTFAVVEVDSFVVDFLTINPPLLVHLT